MWLVAKWVTFVVLVAWGVRASGRVTIVDYSGEHELTVRDGRVVV